jgi:predicted dinucleotide-binding enzyme
MIIAVLGAANVGHGLATRFAAAGHEVPLANSWARTARGSGRSAEVSRMCAGSVVTNYRTTEYDRDYERG